MHHQPSYESSKSDTDASSSTTTAISTSASDGLTSTTSNTTTTTTTTATSSASAADSLALVPVSTAPTSPTSATAPTTASASAASADKKLETPLAAMLPSKYANIDVRELFPDFRPDKVLRFSRLFGPGKPSSLPQIWRSVRKRRNRRKPSRDGDGRPSRDGSDSTSESDERSANPSSASATAAAVASIEARPRAAAKGFAMSYGPDPLAAASASGGQPSNIVSDDEDRLLCEVTDAAKERADQDAGEAGDQKPRVADWRYGPAQVWYDMLEVADSGEGFNYGFKLRDRPEVEEEPVIKGEPIPDDAYLMVSQLHWEDDVVWDGNDIKHKVSSFGYYLSDPDRDGNIASLRTRSCKS